MRKIVLFLSISAVAAFMPGCPPIVVIPFDASGEYTGAWSGIAPETGAEIRGCVLHLSLTQNVEAPLPSILVVSGTAQVDYSCDSLNAAEPHNAQSGPVTINVLGTLDAADGLVLASTGDAPAGLTLSGNGADTDGDGNMDTFTGDWSLGVPLDDGTTTTITGTLQFDRIS